MWKVSSIWRRLCRLPLLQDRVFGRRTSRFLVLLVSVGSVIICLAMLQTATQHHLYIDGLSGFVDDGGGTARDDETLNWKTGSIKDTDLVTEENNELSSNDTLRLFQTLSKRTSKMESRSRTIPDSTQFPDDSSAFAHWSTLMANRTALLRHECTKYSKNTDIGRDCGLRLDGIYIDKDHKYLYCAIPKVGSSSVKLALSFMRGKLNSSSANSSPVHDQKWLRNIGIYAVDYMIENDSTWLKTYWSSLQKFVIVRHPLERIISAYVDKFTRRNKYSDFFQHRFGRRIVRMYRNASSGRNLNQGADDSGHDVTFSEFVRFLTDKKLSCQHRQNPHWMSYVELCIPCFIDYDYIIHLEGLHDELLHLWKVLFNRTNIDEVLLQRNAGNEKSRNLVSRYMSYLSAESVDELYNVYSNDFKLFWYNKV